ncbi:diaminobutyrate acetyltransferase [Actinotalea sp. C106]|uniref:diaminobutyrate acetyltransferase n=1 Tax=Actinotalea sp. C106 TaxID=2908644 RepID=UPI0020283CDB|nr:diaminobutyrate acetyltransferase [Actinotalea sp. C106]
MPPEKKNSDGPDRTDSTEILISVPEMADGASMWRIARDSGSLDLNSSYAYLLFCRDFSRTCRLATVDGESAGFVLGYRRPDRPDCLFVWQVAVDANHRGAGISSRLLDDLVTSELEPPIRTVETTITDDNAASQALFAAFARRWGAELSTSTFITAEHFPDGHDGEPLYEIGPLDPGAPRAVPAR